MKRAAVLLVAACLPLMALAQDWKVYSYPDAGFAVQFPLTPTIEQSTFQAPGGASLPMRRYRAQQDQVVYTMSVVDYGGVNTDDTAVIAQTEKSMGDSGKVLVALDARINREYGRELTVVGADGSRSTVAIFFFNKHLYLLDAQALPPNAIGKSGSAVRFQQSLQFISDNGGFGGFGRFGASARGRFGGGPNPQAVSACAEKSAGDAVQLNTPNGLVAATCVLVARPNRRPDAPLGEPPGEGPPDGPAPGGPPN